MRGGICTPQSTDADGDALVHTIVQQAANGIGEMEDATLLFYNPNAGFTGADYLVYSVTDGTCAVEDTVFITISPSNNCPVAVPAYDMIETGTTSSVQLSTIVSDPDGDQLLIPTISASNGEAVISFGYIIYAPEAGFVGTDTVVFTISDGICTVSDTLFVIVTPLLNNCPVTRPLTVSIPDDTAITFQLEAADADNDALTFAESVDPANGSITLSSTGSVTYTPDPGFGGMDLFVFTVSDGECTVEGTVYLTVVVCPLGHGYWRNHQSEWELTALPMFLGSVSYTKPQLVQLLTRPVGGGNRADASRILARRLVAANLNIANGVIPPQAVLDYIAVTVAWSMRWEQTLRLNGEQFKRLVGVRRSTFVGMVEYPQSLRTVSKHKVAGAKRGPEPKLSVADELMLLLMYYREYRTFFHISTTYDLSEMQTWRIITRTEQQLLSSKLFALPGKKKLVQADHSFDIVLADVREHPIRRPKKTAAPLLRQEEAPHPEKPVDRGPRHRPDHLCTCGHGPQA